MRLRAAIWVVPLAGVTLLPLLWIVAVPYLPWKLEYASEIRQGSEIVSKIEEFREQHGRLPNPDSIEEMTALGFELIIGYRPAYRSLGHDAYEIEYYIGFDGPRIIYSSQQKLWHREY